MDFNPSEYPENTEYKEWLPFEAGIYKATLASISYSATKKSGLPRHEPRMSVERGFGLNATLELLILDTSINKRHGKNFINVWMDPKDPNNQGWTLYCRLFQVLGSDVKEEISRLTGIPFYVKLGLNKDGSRNSIRNVYTEEEYNNLTVAGMLF